MVEASSAALSQLNFGDVGYDELLEQEIAERTVTVNRSQQANLEIYVDPDDTKATQPIKAATEEEKPDDNGD